MAPALPGTCPAREKTREPLGCSPTRKALRKPAASSSARVGLSRAHPSRAAPSRGDPQPRPDLPVRQSRARVNTTALIFALDLRAEQESWARGAPANPTPAGAEGSPPGPRARGTALSLRVLRSSPGSYQLSLPLLLVPSERPGLRRRYLCRRGSSAEISQRLGPGTRSRRAMWRAVFKDRAAPARSAGLAGAASKQELPAGRASPAKELFTLPVTQIPAGPAALPGPLAAPRDWPPARGQGLFPQGFGRPYPDPSPRPRVCAPSPGRSRPPLFPLYPQLRGPGSCAPASPRWGPGQSEGSAQSRHQHWHGHPKTLLSPSQPQVLPCPIATSPGIHRNRAHRAEPGLARGERGQGERGHVPRWGCRECAGLAMPEGAATEE